MKKALAIILSTIILLALFAGCTQQAAPIDSTVPEANEVPGAADNTSAPETKADPVVITLLLAESESEWNIADTPNFKEIQAIFLDKFNCDYQLQTALPTELLTVINTLLSSGQQLPDMINYAYSSDKLMELYQSGSIISLNELIEAHAPEVKSLMYDFNPYLVVAHGDRDGNILRIPADYQDMPEHLPYVVSIRNDWLSIIGTDYTKIKTPDDLYNALKQFQVQDVNGNGKPDEVFTAYNTSDLNEALSNAFGVPYMRKADNSWTAVDGKIISTFTFEKTREYVEYAAKLYAEKLLDNSYMNQTGELFNEKLANNTVAGTPGMWWDGMLHTMAVRDKGFTEADEVPLVPPLTKEGNVPVLNLRTLTGYGAYMITKDCAAPEVAMQLINWGYSLEGTIKNYYGEPNADGTVYYTVPRELEGFADLQLPEFLRVTTDLYDEAIAQEPLLRNKMGWNQQFTTKKLLGNADSVAYEYATSFANGGTASSVPFNLNSLNQVVQIGTKQTNFVAPSVQQAKDWENFADLFMYMDEMIERFITGKEPLSGWDAYVAKCEELGLSQALAIKQEQYDAYTKIMSNLK